MVKTPSFQCRSHEVRSLVGEDLACITRVTVAVAMVLWLVLRACLRVGGSLTVLKRGCRFGNHIFRSQNCDAIF